MEELLEVIKSNAFIRSVSTRVIHEASCSTQRLSLSESRGRDSVKGDGSVTAQISNINKIKTNK